MAAVTDGRAELHHRTQQNEIEKERKEAAKEAGAWLAAEAAKRRTRNTPYDHVTTKRKWEVHVICPLLGPWPPPPGGGFRGGSDDPGQGARKRQRGEAHILLDNG